MSGNKFMHPRNPYRTPSDFKTLAIEYPEFRKYAKQDLAGKIHLDFKNPEALRALTRSLLLKDFQLDVTIPVNRLIPTLPLRLNYVLWVEDLLSKDPVKSDEIWGIDIGTGATCIYPLLGSRKNGWKFVATEMDELSLDCARKNVERNKLEESIKVLPGCEENVLLDAVSVSNHQVAFCMCNPPFFSNHFESSNDETNKRTPVNPGSTSEKIAVGGEIEFVKKIISDSVKLRREVRIYTTMLGKKASVNVIKAELRKRNVEHLVTTEFCQGKIVRWGVAWTFVKEISLQTVDPLKKKQKPPMTLVIPTSMTGNSESLQDVRDKLVKLLADYKINAEEKESSPDLICLHVIAKENTWIHQRRQRRALLRQQGLEKQPTEIIDKINNKRPIDDICEDSEPNASKKMCLTHTNGDSSSTKEECNNGKKSNHEEHLDCKGTSFAACESYTPTEKVNCSDDTRVLSSPTDSGSNETAEVVSSTSFEEIRVSFVGDDVNSKDSRTQIALGCEMILRKIGKKVVILELNWLDGHLGRNGVYQLLQFLKNRLK